MNVAVIGASNKTYRYSYQALMLLKEKGHQVFPVHPKLEEIDGLKVYQAITAINEPIDTITMYVGEKISTPMIDDILSRNPRRIIFNPGAENADLDHQAQQRGIETLNACTLVLLRTGQF